MNATNVNTGQRLTVLATADNGDLIVQNKNGKRFHIPSNIVRIHS